MRQRRGQPRAERDKLKVAQHLRLAAPVVLERQLEGSAILARHYRMGALHELTVDPLTVHCVIQHQLLVTDDGKESI